MYTHTHIIHIILSQVYFLLSFISLLCAKVLSLGWDSSYTDYS